MNLPFAKPAGRALVAALFAVPAAAAAADLPLADRVRRDFADFDRRGVVHYTVDPMCETQYLPDAYPADGRAGAAMTIIAAKGEYEPGAFLLYGVKDFAKVRFEPGDLRSAEGRVFPKAKLDLKTVKVWYQAGNAWFSYFADKTTKLCPELLLNDEDLVKVDLAKRCNYARLVEKDGSVRYLWLNEPQAFHNRLEDYFGWYFRVDDTFMCMKPNFKDAPEHRGARIVKGEFKEFLLTANVAKDQPAGVYRGAVKVVDAANGAEVASVPVVLRVLDFELPRPCCLFDTAKEYKTWFCDYTSLDGIRVVNGNDAKLADEQLLHIVADFARHGQTIPSFRNARHMREVVEKGGQEWSEDIIGDSAKVTDVVWSRAHARELRRQCERDFGRNARPITSWGDEYGLATLKGIRKSIDEYTGRGFRFMINSHSGYSAGVNLADIYWPSGAPDRSNAGIVSKYNLATAGDGYYGWYANQHVGCENPAFARRQYGIGPWRAGLSCNFNYAHHLCGWNDTVSELYRPMMFVYGTGNGCVDTLAWEGFREGLDDIRYATFLKRLADRLAKSDRVEARYAARLALKLIADANADNMDLTTFRREMIVHIEKLAKLDK